MVYIVEAKLISGFEGELLDALESGALGKGKVYEKQLQQALREARFDDGLVRWIETCHCASPLAAEREDLDQFFVALRTEVLDENVPLPELPGEPLVEVLKAKAARQSDPTTHWHERP